MKMDRSFGLKLRGLWLVGKAEILSVLLRGAGCCLSPSSQWRHGCLDGKGDRGLYEVIGQ